MRKYGLILLSYCYVTLGLTACDSGFQSKTSGWSSIEVSETGILIPDTDKLDSNCLSSTNYDSCIYLKSPSAQESRVFTEKSLTDVSSFRSFGIKLTGLDPSGTLKNSNFQIQTLKGVRVQTDNPEHLKPSNPEQQTYLQQLMAYYWTQRTFEFYKIQTGGLALENKNLKLIIDDSLSGFKPSTNTIHLSTSDKRLPMALDASVVLHFVGQANVYWGSDGRIYDYRNDSSHKACNGDPKGCCTSSLGCSRALLYGSADYLVSTIFPNSPALSETWSQNLKGQDLCGVHRSVEEVSQLNVSQAYGLCAGSSLQGHAHVMGLIYASIWWEVRKKIMNFAPGEVPNIDKLHMEHLKLLSGEQNFSDARESIFQTDTRLFNGRYSSLFKAEFKRRGL